MRFIRLFLFCSFSVVLFLLTTYLAIRLSLKREASVECPKIEGKHINEARTILEKAGLFLTVASYRKVEDVPFGVIMQQDPKEGTPVKKGRKVYAVVSKGPRMLPCPHILGMQIGEAESHLQEKNLKIAKVIEVPSRHLGIVLGQSPPPFSAVREGSGLTVFVGTEQVEYFLIPEVSLEDLEALEQELREKGIPYRMLFERSENYGIIPKIELSKERGRFLSTKEELVVRVGIRR